MPIVEAVCALLTGKADVQSVVSRLMKRPLVSERR
jgi:glycerol-3-phosphate dehydrogenase (NAD(P)+)